MSYLDTHVALWLHDAEEERLSPAARRQISRGDLRVSPVVMAELQWLFEVGRLRVSGESIAARWLKAAWRCATLVFLR
jgi:PIN domain nuclease of toxin-antitoxin system